MKRTTKSLIALLVLVAMCVSFCVPTFAADDSESNTACVLAGKTHTLAGFGFEKGEVPAEDDENVETIRDVVSCEKDGYTIYKCRKCTNVYFFDNWVEGDNTPHEWDETKTQVVAPTCELPGYTKKTCAKCGETKELEPTIATDHNYVGGVKYYKGEVKPENEISADSVLCPEAENVTMVSTCQNENCDVDGGKVETSTLDKAEHDLVVLEWIKKPNCVEAGSALVKCTKCSYGNTDKGGVEIEVEASMDDPKAHDWKYDKTRDDYVAPTCNAAGLAKDAVCKRCGAQPTDEEGNVIDLVIDASGDHAWDSFEAEEPSCTEDGNIAYEQCKNCGTYRVGGEGGTEYVDNEEEEYDAYEEEIKIPATNHAGKTLVTSESIPNSCYNYGKDEAKPEGVVVGTLYPIADKVELTDANKGWGMSVYYCAECDGKYVEYVAPYAHPDIPDDPDDDRVHEVQQPTHGMMGMITDACFYCGDYTYVELTPKYIHKVSIVAGQFIKTANMVLVESAEKDGGTVYTVEPTCTTGGQYVFVCDVNCDEKCEDYVTGKENEKCGHVTVVEVEALDHDYQPEETAPNCVKSGFTQDVCTRCGDVDLTDGGKGKDAEGKYNILPINGEHKFKEQIITNPTCDEKGWAAQVCEACGLVKNETVNGGKYEVDALDHNWYNEVANADGTKWNYATTDEINEFYGYTKAKDKIKQNPIYVSCINDGSLYAKCVRCGDISEKIEGEEAWNHKYHNGTDENGNYLFAVDKDAEGNIIYEAIEFEYNAEGFALLASKVINFYKGVAPDCDDFGYLQFNCLTCGADGRSKTDATAECQKAKLGHSFEQDGFDISVNNPTAVITTPKCDGKLEHGTYHFVCTVDGCGASSKANTVPATHPDYNFDITKPSHHTKPVEDGANSIYEATCTQRAIKRYKCEDCRPNGEWVAWEVLQEALPHCTDKVIYQAADPATCTEDGTYAIYRCKSGCDGLYYAVPAADSTVTYYLYTVAADAVEEALDHLIERDDCTVDVDCARGCGYTEAGEAAHDKVNLDAKEATCTSTGLTSGWYCKNEGCKQKVEQTETSELSHEERKTLNKVTCTTDGFVRVDCERCGEYLRIESYTYAIGHSFEGKDVDEATSTEPSCINDGLYFYVCDNGCGTVTTEGEVIQGGFALVDGEDNPVVDEEGNQVYDYFHMNKDGQKFTDTCLGADGKPVDDSECVRCNKDIAVEHNDVLINAHGDCTIAIYKSYICTVCNRTRETEFETPNDAHEWSDEGYYIGKGLMIDGVEVEGKKPTFNEEGYKIKYCTVEGCNYVERDPENASAAKKYTVAATGGVEFNFEITNKQYEVQEAYAGRIYLVIKTDALDANVSSINLRVKFDKSVLKFVGGFFTAADTVNEEGKTENIIKENGIFTAANSANAGGYVGIVVNSLNMNNFKINEGDFAVLEFQIKDTKTAGTSLNVFEVDEDITAIGDKDKNPVPVYYDFPETVADAETRALGKLTDDGKAIGVHDFTEMINVYFGEYRAEADLNGDGRVDADDFDILESYLVGNDPEELKSIVDDAVTTP